MIRRIVWVALTATTIAALTIAYLATAQAVHTDLYGPLPTDIHV